MLSEQLRVEIQRNIAASLAEDIGTGDLTARLIAPDTEARGRVITREDAVICGTAWFDAAFAALSPAAVVHWHVKDGDTVKAGQLLCEIIARAATAEAAFTRYFGPRPDADLRRSTRHDEVQTNKAFWV